MSALEAAVALAIPDPRKQPVPPSWCENVALPAIAETTDWNALDEYEGRLRAVASYIDSFEGDILEFEKALRIVEKRRGELLDKKFSRSKTFHPEESAAVQSRWRSIAANWETVWPVIRDAKTRREVTQAAVLRLVTPPRHLSVVQSPDAPPAAGSYGVVVADPPWQYDNRATRGAAEDHYPTMTLDELRALPAGAWAAPQSHLYLWTTNGFLREAFTILDAWGFTYKTTLVWVKPQIGMGNYFRSSTEYVLFGVKGSLRTLDSNQRNWFEAPRGRHSKKPGCFFDLVEKCSAGPYLEMFAREKRLGWDVWGNEA